jgi:hypothetical protein
MDNPDSSDFTADLTALLSVDVSDIEREQMKGLFHDVGLDPVAYRWLNGPLPQLDETR